MSSRVMGTGLAVAVMAVLATATAFACVPVASLQVSPAEAAPGEALLVTGRFYNENPVTLRWNSVDGRALATITPDNRTLEGTVRVPRDAEPGNYTLVATQEPAEGATTWGIPSRALVTVVGAGGLPVMGETADAVTADRLPALEQSASVGAGEFALVALGVAGVVLFAAGAAALAAGRSRRRVPETARSGE